MKVRNENTKRASDIRMRTKWSDEIRKRTNEFDGMKMGFFTYWCVDSPRDLLSRVSAPMLQTASCGINKMRHRNSGWWHFIAWHTDGRKYTHFRDKLSFLWFKLSGKGSTRLLNSRVRSFVVPGSRLRRLPRGGEGKMCAPIWCAGAQQIYWPTFVFKKWRNGWHTKNGSLIDRDNDDLQR